MPGILPLHQIARGFPGERHAIAAAKGLHNRTEAYNFYYKYLLGKEMPAEFWK